MTIPNKLLVIFILLPASLLAQIDTTRVNKPRLRGFVVGGTAAYSLTLAMLSHAWYSNEPKQSFKFFNDNAEWKQVDKLGHFYSAFYFSYVAARGLKWCRVPDKKADWIGALTGFAALVPIEILDGYSAAYGASTGDLIADAGGAILYLGQRKLWNEIRIHPKISFSPTNYASKRPDVLGDTYANQILKDYNGHTFWLSVDMDKFIRFPKWLNIAGGYGAEGMVYARDYQNVAAGFNKSFRQYYLSLDFDLTAIKTRSKAIRTLIFVANIIKLPAPTLELSRRGFRIHAIQF